MPVGVRAGVCVCACTLGYVCAWVCVLLWFFHWDSNRRCLMYEGAYVCVRCNQQGWWAEKAWTFLIW